MGIKNKYFFNFALPPTTTYYLVSTNEIIFTSVFVIAADSREVKEAVL